MMRHSVAAAIVLISGIFSAACAGEGTTPAFQPSLTIAPPQNPYQSATSTPTAAPPAPTIPEATPAPLLPSPTPLTHAVQSGDTLFGIALQYGITLDQLVSANPGVDTAILSVGTELIIPFLDQDDLSPPTATPLPVSTGEPVCFPGRDGGLSCLMMLVNNQDFMIEYLTALFQLRDQNGDLVQSQVGSSPLYRLAPGLSLPITAVFPSYPGDDYQVSAILLTALPSDRHSLQVVVSDFTINYFLDNQAAQISGTVQTTDKKLVGDEIWIAAVAFSQGRPVGVRKWISSGKIKSEEIYPFEISLYSLGPPIDQIRLLTEFH